MAIDEEIIFNIDFSLCHPHVTERPKIAYDCLNGFSVFTGEKMVELMGIEPTTS